MYRWLRNTHLILGLFGFLYLLVFGVSSVRFSHRNWFPVVTTTRLSKATIPADAATSARSVARELIDKHGLSGELVGGRETPAGFSFQLVKSGIRHAVEYTKSTGEARITSRTPDFMSMLVNLHVEHGLWHEHPVREALGIFVGLVSAALVILALTGIYLWFKMHQERLVGIVLLAISLGYSLTAMILLGIA